MTKDFITTKISKYMSLLLRHDPGAADLALDAKGFAPVADLVTAVRTRYPSIAEVFDEAALDGVVRNNDKKRFEYDSTGTMLRACQGHSIGVDLGLAERVPPPWLYHGTARANLKSIIKSGLERRNRDHVHLSEEHATAKKVGSRHGEPVVLTVLARAMRARGFKFYRSTNGVWLVDHVPSEFISTAGNLEL